MGDAADHLEDHFDDDELRYYSGQCDPDDRQVYRVGSLGGFCPYCGAVARICRASDVYGPKAQQEWGNLLVCTSFPRCDAYVGCHPDGTPKGTLANAQLRDLRRRVHAVFDPRWITAHRGRPRWSSIPPGLSAATDAWAARKQRRAQEYRWLAGKLGMPVEECHIGKFDAETCERALRALGGETDADRVERLFS